MGCTATVYLFGLLGYARRDSFLWITFLSAAGIYFSLLVLTLFNGLYWTVDAAGVYRRGSGYWISILFSVLPLLLNMGLLIRKGTRLSKRERLAFWVYSALPRRCRDRLG